MTQSIRKEDWERYRALGEVPPSVREVVLRSWERSRAARTGDQLKAAPRLGEEDLAETRKRSRRLRGAARGALERAGYLLGDSESMLLLCDAAGVVTDAVGDSSVMDRGRENHLQPGGRWLEATIGTNAIGTALHLGRPVAITGVEHFCEEIQRWSCAAAPVTDPASGRLIGVVDVSGPAGRLPRQAAALSGAVGAQIEEALRQADTEEHQRLVERLLARGGRWASDEVVLLDRFGREVYASERFRGMAAEFGDFEAARALLSAGDLDGDGLVEALSETLPGASVDLMLEGAEAVGVTIALRRSRSRGEADRLPTLDWIGGGSPAMAAICAQAKALAKGGVPLLIAGETGTGKELVARAIHREGPLAACPFEVLNCALLTVDRLRDDIAAGEGAARLGRTGGVLCLDEPLEIPEAAQAMVARLVEKLMTEAGARLAVVTLTTGDLAAATADGRLRGDLYYRLAGAALELPPLAERREDVGRLARFFAEAVARRSGRREVRFTPAAMTRLEAHDWPGNVRELRNLVETMAAISTSGIVDLRDLPAGIREPRRAAGAETLRGRERVEILDAIAETGGNLTEVARRLGIARSTLYVKLDEHGIERPRRH
ncbi:sigma 54-interacting transcriptional regulator [Amaricoccus sp.]|uniref:sigma-54-dependent Fis family transcriptional regulator n=1 Tax=Amaricoccus sp. TaxID=1872485 RepID=UPI00261A7BA6|nr:sigma 54-interacting transcriptional regulator [Amaricoccus sp.]HRO10033.1 sigma 54-interacting transcriptional regulator [Amaricoccus sp.]